MRLKDAKVVEKIQKEEQIQKESFKRWSKKKTPAIPVLRRATNPKVPL